MGLTQDAEKTVRSLTGMWWPDADEDGLRKAAKAWTDCANAIDDVCGKANTTAQGILQHNSGPAVDAFAKFWGQYYDNGKGWLHDVADACRQMAKAFTQYADEVGKAKHQLEEKIAVVGGVLIAGTALAFFTGGLSEAAADGAAAAIVSTAAAVGVTVSETVATIAGTVLTGAVFGAAESATVDLAVAQPIKIAFGDQNGISGTEILDSAETGGLTGGATSGFGAGARILAQSSDTLAPALNALNTMPGRMLLGGGIAAGQDTVFNGGIDPLDIAAGIIGGAAAPGGKGNDDSPSFPKHAKPVELPFPGRLPPREYVEDHPGTTKVLNELANVPPDVFNRVWDHLKTFDGGGISIGPRPVTELPGGYHLAGGRPMGADWGWEGVPGMYDPQNGRLVINSAADTPTSVAVHEFGHATDHAYGNLSSQPDWQNVQQQVMNRIGNNPALDSYIRQPHEYFAEAFNAWANGSLKKFTFGDRTAAKILKDYFDRAL
ncbi:anthrax toxin lethal factor-related metalloendopeptidase [Kitasatospora viridis]|uniref:Uncharacterized protein n=1 Tax=Kitasatospora viridis TaxID=281105 RepID=A0A561UHK7_9ACTN|nr:hypothetical protein [Kitasatospora viridis]TWF98849.1 hypothetical protein FHX73_112676 [Kitasatospora viridis]